MEKKDIKVDQAVIHVEEYTSPNSAIVFLHFGGANLMMWQRAIPYFQNNYRLILLDLRGHGKSSQPATDYDMDTMARDVKGVMENLTIQQAHVIGSSLGAEVGLSLAASYPDRVLSLVCDGALSSEYGPYGTWDGSPEEYNAHVEKQLEKMHASPETIYPSIDALVEKSQAGLSEIGWWNEHVEAMERYGAYQLDDGGYVKAFRKFAREDYFRHYFHYRFEDYYRRVHCPLLMVAGEDVFDDEAEKNAMQGLCELAPQARIAKVSAWQHPYGWMLDPSGVCSEILKFLGEVDQANPLSQS